MVNMVVLDRPVRTGTLVCVCFGCAYLFLPSWGVAVFAIYGGDFRIMMDDEMRSEFCNSQA